VSTRPIDTVLTSAERYGLKPSGRGRWRMVGACHGARRTLSVSIAEGNDGAALLHCFAGCPIDTVLGVLGLQAQDLFPPRPAVPGDGRKPTTRPFSVIDLINALSAELRVAWVVLADIASDKPLAEGDRRRAGIARDRCVALLEELKHVR